MKPGDIVTVYEDPFTQQKIEGKAMLREKLTTPEGCDMERWRVRFIGESECFERWIKEVN